MAAAADPQIVQEIRRLAVAPTKVLLSATAFSDLAARQLTKADVCDSIVHWIDAGGRVKPTVLHSFPGLQGAWAYEMKPRLRGRLYYLKVALVKLQESTEHLLLISAHPDH